MINGMRSTGSATLVFTKEMEVELVLSMNKYIESDNSFDKDEYDETSGTVLERLLAYAGFTIISRKVNMKGNEEYTIDLIEFWKYSTQPVIRFLVSVGMSIQAGFGDQTGSFSWFLTSDLGSKRLKIDEYSI